MASSPSLRSVWLLLAGRTVSRFGSSFYLIALPLFLLRQTGDLAQSGFFFTLSNLPPLLAVPFLGSLVGRCHRKRLLVLCDAATAILYLVLFLLPQGVLFPLLLGTMGIGLLSHLFELCSKLLFTELTDEDTLPRCNSIKSVLDQCAAVLAPAIGSAVFGLFGFRAVLLLCTLTYFLSARQECFIPYPISHARKLPDQSIGAGLSYLKSHRDIRLFFVLVMVLNFFVANCEEIIFPGILTGQFHLPDALFGLLTGSATLGAITAGLLLLRLDQRSLLPRLKLLFLLNSALMVLLGLAAPLMRALPSGYFLLFLLLQFCIGGITSAINIPLLSFYQIRVPLEQQGPFFALLAFFSGILVPLGISYTGMLAQWLGADMAYVLNNLCVIVIVLLIPLPRLDVMSPQPQRPACRRRDCAEHHPHRRGKKHSQSRPFDASRLLGHGEAGGGAGPMEETE